MGLLMVLAIALVVLWAVAWIGFHVAGFMIHLLLIAAVLLFIAGFARRAAPR